MFVDFFFQAEDGIRDGHVTGVQTCALPILKCDQMEAEQIGIQSVPFYVFDEQYAVKGIQPSEVLVDVLEQVWEGISEDRKRAFKHRPKNKTTYCSGESCNQNE